MTKYQVSSQKKSRQNQRSRGADKKFKIFNMFLLALIAVCGAYYVALVNDLTVKGLKVQELKKLHKSS